MTIVAAAIDDSKAKCPGRSTRRRRNALERAGVARLETIAAVIDAIEAQRPLRRGEASEILRAARKWPAGGGRIEGVHNNREGGDDNHAS